MNKHRPTLCIVAGPNGSGKTTTTLKLLANEWAADSLYITASPPRDAFLCLSAQAVHQFIQVCATAILAGQFAVEAPTEAA